MLSLCVLPRLVRLIGNSKLTINKNVSGCLSCVGLLIDWKCLSLQDIWDAIELSHDSELEKGVKRMDQRS